MAVVLHKRHNAGMGTDRPTLRAFLWCSATALQCLTRTTAIVGALRLVAKHHRNAEYGNIIMAVYSYNDEWIQYMTEAWGEAPTIDFSDCPIVVDNEINKTTLVEST